MLCALAMLAAFSVIQSELPRFVAWPLAVLAIGYGLWLARSEWRKSTRSLVISGDSTTVSIDNVAVDAFAIQWRGSLAFGSWRDAEDCTQRLVWWPDTLSKEARRELRLAAATPSPARAVHSMAT